MALQQEAIKWVAGTNFMVDGFRFQNPRCKHYFLTHYHSDHTIGLYKSFSSGIVYCSPITAALLTNCMGLRSECIQVLPMDRSLTVEGVEVTALDANHCPGSVMLLFKVPGRQGRPGQVILHTGDFRYHERMADYPSLRNTVIDTIYLDTTYAYPRHTFPSQEDAIATIVRLCRKHLDEEACTLFVFGAYQIGKERAVIGAAKALDLKVHIEPRKRRILSLLELEDMDVFTPNAAEANIHLGFMSEVRPPAMLRRLKEGGGQWAHVVGFRPTGWSFRKDGVHTTKQGLATVYGVPYSEHSSFDDLRACIAALRPRKIIPTVNADTKLKAANLVARFADLMDLSASRYRIDAFFRPRPLKRPQCGPGAAYASKRVGVAADGSEQTAQLTTEKPGFWERENSCLDGDFDGRGVDDDFLGAPEGGTESCGADVSGRGDDSGFGGFETQGLEGLDCEAPAEEAGFTGADDGVSEVGEEMDREGMDTDTQEDADTDADTDAGSEQFGGDSSNGAVLRGYGSCEKSLGETVAGLREEPTDGRERRRDAFAGVDKSASVPGCTAVAQSGKLLGEGSWQPLGNGGVVKFEPVDDMQETSGLERSDGWNGVEAIGRESNGLCGLDRRGELTECREVVGPGETDWGFSKTDRCATDGKGKWESSIGGCFSDRAASGGADGCHVEGNERSHVAVNREADGNGVYGRFTVQQVPLAISFASDVSTGLLGDGEETRMGEESFAASALCAEEYGEWECGPQPKCAVQSTSFAAVGIEAGGESLEQGSVRSAIVDASRHLEVSCVSKGNGNEACEGGRTPLQLEGDQGSRRRKPSGESPLLETRIVHSCEVSVDISTIDSREQAYILRCIEQAKVKEKPDAKVIRKGAALRGSQTVVRKGSLASGKKPKLTTPSVPIEVSQSTDKANRQRLIRSFFSSKT